MMSCYFIVIFIVYLLKPHHCLPVTKGSDESLELKMFLLNLFDQVAQKVSISSMNSLNSDVRVFGFS